MGKRVYLIHTGGTLGMQRSPHGYATVPGHLEQLLTNLPELKQPGMPTVIMRSLGPLLDSSNPFPENWLKIGAYISEHTDQLDGFVILSGSDTTAYTDSALAFMLEGCNKPLIRTGLHIPFREMFSDVSRNPSK
jgi:L-asparaginase